MIANDWIQILVSLGLIVLIAPLVGRYLAWIYQSPHLSLEKGIYRLLGLDADREMGHTLSTEQPMRIILSASSIIFESRYLGFDCDISMPASSITFTTV